MVWHQHTYRTYVYQSHQSPLASLSALQLVETSSSLAPDFVLAIGHSPSLVLRCGTVCRPTFDLHQHSLLSRIGSRLICFYSHIFYFEFHQLNSSSVYVVRRPCSDFTDMLRRHINCRIIIIISTNAQLVCSATCRERFHQ